jgi:hypothetical protein
VGGVLCMLECISVVLEGVCVRDCRGLELCIVGSLTSRLVSGL